MIVSLISELVAGIVVIASPSQLFQYSEIVMLLKDKFALTILSSLMLIEVVTSVYTISGYLSFGNR